MTTFRLAALTMAALCSAAFLAGPLRSADDPAPVPVGDGVADDTVALQALVDAGGAVRLPAGTHRITAPIVINLQAIGRTSISGDGAARVVMAGPGPAFRFVGTHDGTAAPSSVKDRVWARENAPMLDGVEIVGDHPQADGVGADGTMQLTLTRLVVRKARHAVRLTGRNRNVTLSECHLYENRGVGVLMEDVNLHQIDVANCHISYNAGGGVVARGSEIRNLQIGTCDLEANVGPANEYGAPANVWLDSTHGTVAEVAIVGCTIQHSQNGERSANIRVTSGGPFPGENADDFRTGHLLIADNVLSDVQTNIELTGVRAATVTGNTLWQGFTANLVAEDCTRLILANNVLDRGPLYHVGRNASAKLGVRLERCTDCTITGNHSAGEAFAEAAVILRDCERVNLTGNTITDYGAAGLLLDGVTTGLVTGNLIRDDRPDEAGVALLTENLRGVTLANNLLGEDAE
ncbi:right-handed parallel beta-helix repeat-containing protein [Alienimonas chondri]|uniref:Right handed beta helix domain-containing protein n=1 Tax=Alienimonas chondri TaxID=2681879 RepID=A0ABX1VAR9_9PLAN|nr:right-handed parallel beta-helix repeat-containing protein [Alienimonas chondri]NNJ25154.1 hypothetical protein [Alienimonas chondri]